MKVDIWSDVVCPFCYIGKKRLEHVAEQMGESLDVHWHSFELDPASEPSYPEGLVKRVSKKYGMSLEEGIASQKRIAAEAAKEGIQFNWEQAKPGNSFMAHQIIHLAKENGLANAAEEAFFRAYMTDGLAIGDKETVKQIAVSIGLDPQEVSSVLDSRRFEKEIRYDELVAHQELQVRGVPFFVFSDAIAVSGAQPREVFEQAIKQAREHQASLSHSEQKPAEGDSGICEDGVCNI